MTEAKVTEKREHYIKIDPSAGVPVEVHNVWTIYGLSEDGNQSEEPMASMSRPQDWGHSRWHYDQVHFECKIDGKRYLNHCHCWTDLRFDNPNEYLQLFAELIVAISLPGTPVQLCGCEYLAEDDFWQEDWGPMPEIWDADEETGL